MEVGIAYKGEIYKLCLEMQKCKAQPELQLVVHMKRNKKFYWDIIRKRMNKENVDLLPISDLVTWEHRQDGGTHRRLCFSLHWQGSQVMSSELGRSRWWAKYEPWKQWRPTASWAEFIGEQPVDTLYLALVTPHPAKTGKMLLNWSRFSRRPPRCLRARALVCGERLR